MKIWMIEPDGSGGMIHYAYQMADSLQAAGAEVTLVTSRHYELADYRHRFSVEPVMRLWPAIEERRPPWLIRKVRRIGRAIRFFIEWDRAIRAAIDGGADVVQLAIIRFPAQGWWLRRLKRRGVEVTQVCHEFELREARGVWNSLHRIGAQRLYRRFDHIYFHGPQTRREFLEAYDFPVERTSLIPHGNEVAVMRAGDRGGDLRNHYGIDPEVPVALFFGGLRPSKGLPDLAAAFRQVRAEIPDAHLLVVGHPSASFDLAGLHAALAGHGATIDARYIPLDDVGAVIRTSDVVVLPYASGTASGALQTAYAFGRPVIASDVGDVAAAVDPGATGMVVPPSDVDALKRAMVKMLSDRAETRRMGDTALERSNQEFAWDRIADQVLAAVGHPK